MELADKILRYRISHKMTQKEMAKAVGINIKTLVAVEKMRKTPTVVTKYKIEEFLKKGE